MRRHACLILATIIAIGSAYGDVQACGDKFLRVGRSARFRKYASVHPSVILLYAPRWTGTGINEFEAILKRAGHKPQTVVNEATLAQALATAKYEIVITGFSHVGAAKEALHAASSTAVLLPVIYKPTKQEEGEAKLAYQCLLRPEKMTEFQALEEIDRLIDLHAKGIATSIGTR
jgi:hypothetical protein